MLSRFCLKGSRVLIKTRTILRFSGVPKSLQVVFEANGRSPRWGRGWSTRPASSQNLPGGTGALTLPTISKQTTGAGRGPVKELLEISRDPRERPWAGPRESHEIGQVRGARAHACRVETHLDALDSPQSPLPEINDGAVSATFFSSPVSIRIRREALPNGIAGTASTASGDFDARRSFSSGNA